jgi:hypothetical protein
MSRGEPIHGRSTGSTVCDQINVGPDGDAGVDAGTGAGASAGGIDTG